MPSIFLMLFFSKTFKIKHNLVSIFLLDLLELFSYSCKLSALYSSVFFYHSFLIFCVGVKTLTEVFLFKQVVYKLDDREVLVQTSVWIRLIILIKIFIIWFCNYFSIILNFIFNIVFTFYKYFILKELSFVGHFLNVIKRVKKSIKFYLKVT